MLFLWNLWFNKSFEQNHGPVTYIQGRAPVDLEAAAEAALFWFLLPGVAAWPTAVARAAAGVADADSKAASAEVDGVGAEPEEFDGYD